MLPTTVMKYKFSGFQCSW